MRSFFYFFYFRFQFNSHHTLECFFYPLRFLLTLHTSFCLLPLLLLHIRRLHLIIDIFYFFFATCSVHHPLRILMYQFKSHSKISQFFFLFSFFFLYIQTTTTDTPNQMAFFQFRPNNLPTNLQARNNFQ